MSRLVRRVLNLFRRERPRVRIHLTINGERVI
jgi:sRNA-binding regulator protein Hfq